MIYKKYFRGKLFYRIYKPQHVGRRIQTVEQIVGNTMLLVDGEAYEGRKGEDSMTIIVRANFLLKTYLDYFRISY